MNEERGKKWVAYFPISGNAVNRTIIHFDVKHFLGRQERGVKKRRLRWRKTELIPSKMKKKKRNQIQMLHHCSKKSQVSNEGEQKNWQEWKLFCQEKLFCHRKFLREKFNFFLIQSTIHAVKVRSTISIWTRWAEYEARNVKTKDREGTRERDRKKRNEETQNSREIHTPHKQWKFQKLH